MNCTEKREHVRDLNSSSADIPVLLTSSIVAHDKGVALKDSDERLRLALESIEQWLKIDPDLPLVLCDGSSFDFDPLVAQRFPHARIECLHFENNQEKVKELGRGFGEGEIVRYALAHSRLIAAAGCFAKCSSKLWVENFKTCKRQWNGKFLCKGVFLNVFSPFRSTEFSYIDTRFYMASTAFYRQYLEDAHLHIDRKRGRALENCFHDAVISYGIKKSLLRVPPVICGVGGGIGKYYKDSQKRRVKEVLRFWLVQKQASFADLFV